MANGHLGGIVRHLKSLLGAETARTSTDGELLQRFARQHDEAAFAALVERYAPLVLGVCRRTLQNDHDAEDVFQATFLVLLRKAGSLDGRGTIANWLYTVAYHLALKARARTGQRRDHERQVADMPEVESQTKPLWNELRPLLDEELDRLPDKYRSPMVLCYLTGKTNEQAAQELGWTKDTVRGRLARGREMLRNRLARRGVTLASTTLAAVLTEHAGQAAVPAAWIDATLKAGALFAAGNGAAAGLSSSVLALVQAGLKEVFVAKVKLAATLCLIVGIAGTGIGLTAAWQTPEQSPGRAPGRLSVRTPVRAAGIIPATPPKYEPYVVEPVMDCPEDELMDDTPQEQPPAPPPPPPVLPKVTIQRRDWACESELQKQLLAVPEVSMETISQWPRVGGEEPRFVGRWGSSSGRQKRPVVELIADHPLDLAGLPRRKNGNSRLEQGPAKDLAFLSRELRAILAEMLAPRGKAEDGIEPRFVPMTLRKNLSERTQTLSHERSQTPIFQNPRAVATLMQMLTGEDNSIRLVLVEQLTRFSHPSATEALARLALFDLAPEVRAAAIGALAARPRAEYRALLLGGFRYPWAPVADHAAEALLALDDRDAVPALKDLARELDPASTSPAGPVIREVVRVNHLRNCVLCHASSESKDDLVRGRIPIPGQRLPPLSEYYQSNEGIFVRADITYLRQDFSVAQPVAKAKDDPWPDRQRYDYLVRTRTLTPEEYGRRSRRPSSAPSPQREAIRYALQEFASK